MNREYILYHSPGACSRVTLTALEEVGVGFEDRAIALLRGEHKTLEYKAISPKGKVPVLLEDGVTLTENPAILWHLASTFPEALLLPDMGEKMSDAQGLSDLVWCGGTLHPLIRQMFAPKLYGMQESDLSKNAAAEFDAAAKTITDRVSGRWWYGHQWSIVDVYIYWINTIAQMAGYEFADDAAIADHAARVRARPSFQRARKREVDAVERFNIPLPPGASL